MLSISTNPYVLLLIVNVLLLVVGMFLDSTTAILVIAPIIAKPLVAGGRRSRCTSAWSSCST